MIAPPSTFSNVDVESSSSVTNYGKGPVLSPFAAGYRELVAAGYHVIPIMPRDKVPAEYNSGRWTPMGGWNSYAHTKPSDASIIAWKSWPDANVGITLGTPCAGYQLIAIDFDTDDADELDMLQSQIPWSPMRKRGARGYTAFYRASIAVRTKRYMVPAPTDEKPDARRTILEILTGNAPRQTVMPPSMHPHGAPYRYVTGNAIVPIAQLPVLSADHFEQLEDTLEHMGWNGAIIEEARRDRAFSTAGGDRDDPNIWRHTNDVALQKLDLWVPELGLPKLKRHSNGRWEAIAAWRESGTGRAMMQRKPNLSLHRNGIKDLGTEVGYTPLDVVGAAFSWDFDTCFSWLRSKIGLGDEGDALLHGAATADTINTFEDDTGTVLDTATGEPVGATNDNRPASADLFPDALTRVPGLLGDVADWIAATARNPDRILALGAALTVLGTLAGRRDAGPTKAGTSLYVLMLATSGAGKQHGLNQVHRLMTAAGAKEHVGPGEFGSVQALNNHLKRAPLSVCAQDEFGSFLKRINDKKAGGHERAISKVLRSTWGINFGVTQTTDFVGTPGQTIYAPCLSIYGVSTPGEFFKSLAGADVENGTLNRFLLLSASAVVEDIEPELEDDATVLRDLEGKLGALFLARERRPPLFDTDPGAREVVPYRVGWHGDDAKAVFDALGAEVKRMRREDEALAPFLARTVEIALRLATIRAVGRIIDDPTIDADDIAWGRDVAMWSARKMAVEVGDFVSDNPTGEIWGKVKNKLRKAGGSGNRRDVARAFTMSARNMDEVVTGMELAGLIRVEHRRPAGGGKPAVWLHLLDGV